MSTARQGKSAKSAARRVAVQASVAATSLAVLAASWFGVAQTARGTTAAGAALSTANTQQLGSAVTEGAAYLGTSASTTAASGFVAAPSTTSARRVVTRSRAS